ncbi:MAG: OB-fold nucleic acid binding domain-containing protein [Candidatus Pacearchaeota archaeon]|nr:OB-fold nucleic acid binding domain-containing protein [Candidatus Pacearchaeota archaeon]
MPDFQRATAIKLRIGDILKGKPIITEERFNFLELNDKQIIRVNIVANIVEKYNSEGEKKYLALTIDDASGQIRLKAFGDDVAKFQAKEQGDTVMVIGLLRYYNNEIYISPEIIKSQDPRYLLVRKLELDKEMPITKEEITEIKSQVIDMIKKEAEGIDTDKIIMELKASPDAINQEISKLIEEGLIYEPRPGKVRWLG